MPAYTWNPDLYSRANQEITQATSSPSGSGWFNPWQYTNGNMILQPHFTGGTSQTEGQDATLGTLSGYQYYDTNNQNPGSSYDLYDPSGNFLKTEQFTDEPGLLEGTLSDPLFWAALATAGGMSAFLPGGFAAGAGTELGAGALGDSTAFGYGIPGEVAASTGGEGLYGLTGSSGTGLTATAGSGLNLATTTGGPGLTATAGPGLELAASTGGGVGLDALTAGTALTSGLTGSGPAYGLDSMLNNNPYFDVLSDGTVIPNSNGTGGAPGPSTGGTPPIPGTPPTPSPSGGPTLNDLMRLFSGLADNDAADRSTDSILSWLNGQMDYVDGLYKPGSDEYNSLWDQMSRTDAAAGRNSQYGPRSVDLAAKIAGIKADARTKMSTGFANVYANAINKENNSYAGLTTALASLFGGANSNWGNTGVVDLLTRLFGGTNNWSGTSLDSFFSGNGTSGD